MMLRRLFSISLLLGLLTPLVQANNYFEAACLNILQGPHNTIVYFHLQPGLLHIDASSGILTSDLEIHIAFAKAGTNRILHKAVEQYQIGPNIMQGMNSFYPKYPLSLEPGPYDVLVEIRDMISRNTHFERISYNCDVLDTGVALSDIVLMAAYEGALETQALVGDRILARPGQLNFELQVYAEQPLVMTTRTVLYRAQDRSRRQADDRDRMRIDRYSVVDQVNSVVHAKTKVSLYSDQLNLSHLAHGEYLLEVFLYEDEKLLAEESRRFTIDWKETGRIFADLDTTISMMAYIASESWISRLRALKDADEKPRAFLKFWEKRSEPGQREMETMERYFRRVFYANDNYEEDRPGWQTDRGRIHILYGPPPRKNSLVREDGNYETWVYPDKGLKFLFFNVDGVRIRQIFPHKW